MEHGIQNPPGAKQPKLLDQVRDAIRTKHYSLKTEEAYIHWIQGVRYLIKFMYTILVYSVENIKLIDLMGVIISPPKKFIFFHNKRHPKEMSEADNL